MTIPATTHITGQGSISTGYAIRIHRAGRDASQRAEQLRGLTQDQVTVIARRLKGLGGARAPRLTSEQVWAALDQIEAYKAANGCNSWSNNRNSDCSALAVTLDMPAEEAAPRLLAAELLAVEVHGLACSVHHRSAGLTQALAA